MMVRPSAPKIHAVNCRCDRCEPARPRLARRFADAMEPGDLDAIRLGLLGGLAAGIALLLLHIAPAVLAAVAALGTGR